MKSLYLTSLSTWIIMTLINRYPFHFYPIDLSSTWHDLTLAEYLESLLTHDSLIPSVAVIQPVVLLVLPRILLLIPVVCSLLVFLTILLCKLLGLDLWLGSSTMWNNFNFLQMSLYRRCWIRSSSWVEYIKTSLPSLVYILILIIRNLCLLANVRLSSS